MSSDDHNDIIEGPPMTPDHSSGRAARDDRGNSVWEWQTAPGVYTRDVDTQRVKALQLADFELLESPSQVHESTAPWTRPGKDFPSRAGIELPNRGIARSKSERKQKGLIGKLIGRR